MKRLAVILLIFALFLCACAKQNENGTDDATETPAADTAPADQGGTEEISTEDWEKALDYPEFDFEGTDLTQYVKIGNYRGLTATRENDVLTEEEYENSLKAYLSDYVEYAKITDRAVEAGEEINVDYTGYLDGVAFAGGTAKGATVTAADNTGYIAGFATAYIGRMPLEEFSFNVTFPEAYANETLRGREVTFVTTVNYIEGTEPIYPELTDAFAQVKLGFGTAAEFSEYFRALLQKQKTFTVQNDLHDDLINQVVENSEVIQWPEDAVLHVYAVSRQYYENYAASYGMDYESFIQAVLQLDDAGMMEESRAMVKEELVVYGLMQEMGITLSEEEYQAYLAELAEVYDMTPEEAEASSSQESLDVTFRYQKMLREIEKLAIIIPAA